jgi:octaprenyl-diphosphate synthase
MTLQFDAALGALSKGGSARSAGDRFQARLDDLQRFLGTELSAVEAAIASVVADGQEPAVAAAQHLVSRGGKRVRPVALLLAARCFAANRADQPSRSEALVQMAAVVELVHSATLLHDDVVDEGMERRGAATSRRLFGNGVSVLSGDLLLVNALDRTRRVAPELLDELIGTLRRLVDGEVIQLRGRTELDVSEATYERILMDKTASLFALATRSGARLAGADAQQESYLAHFGEQLGVAFQLVDDVIDYEGQTSGKNLFADLLDGKLTLPLVLALQRDEGLLPLVRSIHAGEDLHVAEVSARVLSSGSCDEVRKRAREFTKSALSSLDKVPPSPARELLRLVAQEMTRRAF